SPTSAPVSPPAAAPAAAPLSAAMMGPAAMRGPTPGIARAPMRARNPAAAPARCAAGGGQGGPRRDEGPDARDREGTDAREQSQRAPDDATGRCAGGGTLRHLRSLLVREVARPLLVREQHRDVAIGESRAAQIGHDLVRLLLTLCNAQNCVSSHCGLLHWVVRLLRDFEVILDLVRAGDLLCLRGDVLPLVLGLHGAS